MKCLFCHNAVIPEKGQPIYPNKLGWCRECPIPVCYQWTSKYPDIKPDIIELYSTKVFNTSDTYYCFRLNLVKKITSLMYFAFDDEHYNRTVEVLLHTNSILNISPSNFYQKLLLCKVFL
jgi:hypothetical protein